MIIRKHRSADDVTLLRATNAAAVSDWLEQINTLLTAARTQSLRSRTAITNINPAPDLYQPHGTSRGQSRDLTQCVTFMH